eukprot:12109231-Karenia_brevis.AAC.1
MEEQAKVKAYKARMKEFEEREKQRQSQKAESRERIAEQEEEIDRKRRRIYGNEEMTEEERKFQEEIFGEESPESGGAS